MTLSVVILIMQCWLRLTAIHNQQLTNDDIAQLNAPELKNSVFVETLIKRKFLPATLSGRI